MNHFSKETCPKNEKVAVIGEEKSKMTTFTVRNQIWLVEQTLHLRKDPKTKKNESIRAHLIQPIVGRYFLSLAFGVCLRIHIPRSKKL